MAEAAQAITLSPLDIYELLRAPPLSRHDVIISRNSDASQSLNCGFVYFNVGASRGRQNRGQAKLRDLCVAGSPNDAAKAVAEAADYGGGAVSVVADASGCTDRDATGRSATLWRAWSSVSDQSLVDGIDASSASASLAETSSAPKIAALSRSKLRSAAP